MKRWFVLGIILSGLLIGARYLGSFIISKIVERSSSLSKLNDLLVFRDVGRFPPPLVEVLISSIIVGFLAAILIVLAHKKIKEVMANKNENSKSIR